MILIVHFLVVDTWGKFQYGILVGNVNNFGDYDQCVAFSHATELSKVGLIQGKHCMVSFEADDAKSNKFDLDFGWNEM